MGTDGRHAYSLLSKGAQRWVASKGWGDLRPIQSAACISLLEEAPDTSLVISAATASGKALTDSTPVLTTAGWVPIGDIGIGDMAYSRDGRAYPVTGVFPQGMCDTYRMTLADGRRIDCNINHRWLVMDAEVGRERVMTLDQLVGAGLEGSEGTPWRFSIRQTQPILHSAGDEDVSLPVAPYLMGFVTGAGGSADESVPGRFSLYVPDGRKREWLDMGLDAAGMPHETDGRSVTIEWAGSQQDWDAVAFDVSKMADVGIPQMYRISSVAQRRAFIRGFSHACGMTCEATDTMSVVADMPEACLSDFIDMCRSLGLVAKRDGGQVVVAGSLDGDGEPSYTSVVGIRNRNRLELMTCITVDSPDHTFVTEDYVVTHNTEAAFLPALTMVQRQMEASQDDFVYMLYVAPLKALINDQYRRLCEMARPCGIPVYIWHGDAPQGQKQELMREHCGILMTTPESLESFLMNRGRWVGRHLTPIVTVVDEFHSFLGEGRGRQLLSLLDRIDVVNAQNGRRPAVRIGLSATLAKLEKVGRILSPRRPVAIIDGSGGGDGDDSRLALSCFEGFASEGPKGITTVPDFAAMAEAIVRDSGSHKTLTFAKSRKDVETMSATINDVCKANGISSQAFPHHGSLSKETRESLEHRLVSTEKPTMAVATVTLELGIDIGDIYEVFQIGAPNSVASLRQRMGRSGRRGGERNMRCLATVSEAERDMQEEITTIIAEIELMNEGMFEEPNTKRHDVSVLVSEILSVLRQYGTAYPDELCDLLCKRGGFRDVSEELFHSVLADMEEQRLVMMSADGTCMIDEMGEREINDWHFYATFQTEESFSVRAGGRVVGEITPPSTSISMLRDGGVFMLAGRYWQVQSIDEQAKSIDVKQTGTRGEFLVPVSRGGGDVSGMVKRKRISLLVGKDAELEPEYVDDAGLLALGEARDWAREHHLNGLGIHIFDVGEGGHESAIEVKARLMCGWSDDAIAVCSPPVDAATHDAIHKMLMSAGMEPDGLNHLPLYRLHECCEACLAEYEGGSDDAIALMDDAMVGLIRQREKYNHYLSDDTLRMAYADELLDVKGALRWMAAFERFWAREDRGEL